MKQDSMLNKKEITNNAKSWVSALPYLMKNDYREYKTTNIFSFHGYFS